MKPRASLANYEAFARLSALEVDAPIELDGKRGSFIGKYGDAKLVFRIGRRNVPLQVGAPEIERIRTL